MYNLCCVKIKLMNETRYTLYVFDEKSHDYRAIYEFTGEDALSTSLIEALKKNNAFFEGKVTDFIPALAEENVRIRRYTDAIARDVKPNPDRDQRKSETIEEAEKILSIPIHHKSPDYTKWTGTLARFPDELIGAGDTRIGIDTAFNERESIKEREERVRKEDESRGVSWKPVPGHVGYEYISKTFGTK